MYTNKKIADKKLHNNNVIHNIFIKTDTGINCLRYSIFTTLNFYKGHSGLGLHLKMNLDDMKDCYSGLENINWLGTKRRAGQTPPSWFSWSHWSLSRWIWWQNSTYSPNFFTQPPNFYITPKNVHKPGLQVRTFFQVWTSKL